MAIDGPDPYSLGNLIVEVRVAREALHQLVERMRRDRSLWNREIAELARRPRLTQAQRQNLLLHLRSGAA
jgi:hypothetical protein